MSKQLSFDSKKKLKLNDLSDLLKIKKSTIKSWEKEFNLPGNLSESTQKLYSDTEIKLIKMIKAALYDEKLSYPEIQVKIDLLLQSDNNRSFNPAKSIEETIEITQTTTDKACSQAISNNTSECRASQIKVSAQIITEKEYIEKVDDIKKRLLALQEKLK